MDSSDAMVEMSVLGKASAHLRNELDYLGQRKALSIESLLLLIVQLLQER